MIRILLFLTLLSAVQCKLKWRLLSAHNESANFPAPRRDSSIGYNRAQKQVIIFGGRGSELFDDTWIFHLGNNSWTKVNTTLVVIPDKRFSMVFGAVGNYFFISTGEGRNPRRFFNDIWQLEFDSMKWQELKPNTSTKPEERYGASGGIFDDGNNKQNGFYVTHGFSGTRYSNTFRFDFAKQAWEEKFHGSNSYNPSYPHARCLQSGAMTNPDEFVLYGGCLGGGGTGGPCPSKDNWKFVAATKKWTRLEECSTPRVYSAMAMLPPLDNNSQRRAVLYGGGEDNKAVLVTPIADPDEIAVFNPATDNWERKKIEGTTPEKRQGHVMATTDDGIIMFGGSGNGNLNDVWLLEGQASDADDNLSAGGCRIADFNLIALHGLFMFLGWGVFLQTGAFIARYFRHRDPWWFKMHRVFQVIGLLLAIAGVICAAESVPFDHLKFAHGPIGVVVMIIGLQQPFNALIRPHKHQDGSKSTIRVVWEYFHKNLGRVGLILALINISLGFFLAVVPNAVWAVWYALLGSLVILYIVMEVRLLMSRNKTKTAAFPMK